jgi:hypothetical protein
MTFISLLSDGDKESARRKNINLAAFKFKQRKRRRQYKVPLTHAFFCSLKRMMSAGCQEDFYLLVTDEMRGM